MTEDVKPVGRPQFEVTEAVAKRVEAALGLGMTLVKVSEAIGCSVPTLRKYFRAYVETARASIRFEALNLLMDNARDGNAASISRVKEITELLEAAEDFATPAALPSSTAKTQKLGKKEEADLVARTAGEGTDWGPDLMPPRMN